MISRRLEPSDRTLQWLTQQTIALDLPGVLGDLQLCFTEDDEGLLDRQMMLDETNADINGSCAIEPEDGGIDGIDYIAIALAHGTLARAQETLEELLEWENFRLFDPNDVATSWSAFARRGKSAIRAMGAAVDELLDVRVAAVIDIGSLASHGRAAMTRPFFFVRACAERDISGLVVMVDRASN